MTWDTSCRDWQERIRHGRSLLPTLPLVESEASRAVAMFDRLRLPDVPGTPTMAEACGDWARDLVRAIFGSFDPVENVRHVREFFSMVPKKNAKTTVGAGIMVTAVLMSRRPRAEFLLVAPTQEISALAFRQAAGMIECDPALADMFHIQSHLKRLTFRQTGAFLQVKSFDPSIVTGSKPAGVLFDEGHVTGTAHDADRVIGQVRGGLVSQPEAFMVSITTQSERPPAGVFLAELHKARAVRDGRLQAPILPLLYEFPEGVDWRDPANWWMVTPNNGRSITVERLVEDWAAAQSSGEAEVRRWASQHLNVEIGVNLHSDRWAGAEFWERNADPTLTLDTLLARSEVAVVGIDGGGLDDLLGLAVLGRERDTGKWLHWGHAWAHPVVLDRRKSEAPKLRDFEAGGDLTIVDEVGDDVDGVVEIVRRVKDAGLLAMVGVDSAAIGGLVEALEAIGVMRGETLHAVKQGGFLTAAIKTVERKLAGGDFVHGGRPLMAWTVGNAKITIGKNSVAMEKAVAGAGKIDPVVALLDAADLMSRNPAAPNQVAVFFFS